MTQESLALRKLKLSCRAPQDSLSSGQNLRVLYTSYISMNSMEPDPGLWPEFEFSKFFQRVAGACGTWQTVHKSPDPF